MGLIVLFGLALLFLATVNEIEQSGSGLSRRIWQKIMIPDRVVEDS